MNESRASLVLPLFALPLAFLAASLVLRDVAGEAWLWRHLDPDYFYLFDGLGIVNLSAPHHVAHPGVPLSVFVGLVLKALHPLLGGEAIVAEVFAAPGFHLAIISVLLISLNALAMLLVGWVTHRATGNLAVTILVQISPLLSMLTFKFSLRVKPEAFLITTTLIMAALVMLALRPDTLLRHRLRIAVMFGLIAGFGIANKIIAAPLLVLVPVFLLGTWRAVFLFWATAGGAALLFCLPAASETERFVGWILLIGKGSGAFGEGPQTIISFADYPHQFRRMLSRPAASAPLILGVIVLTWGWLRRRKGLAIRILEWRALASLILGVLVLAAIVAKQPSSHYMIPAFCLGGLSLALSVRLVTDPSWWSDFALRRVLRGVNVLVVALVIAQGFALVGAEKDFRKFRGAALALDTASFKNCAQVFFFPASHPDFALLMGHALTGYRYGEQVKAHVADTSYYLADGLTSKVPQIRNADGRVALKDLMGQYPCMVFRGGHEHRLLGFLNREGLANLKFDATCPSPYETAYTLGTGCAKP
jgi:hypothetical protein